MMANLQGFDKRIRKKIDDMGLSERIQEFVINAARDQIIDFLKSDVVADYISEKINEAAAAVGMPLTLTNIMDKDQTRADFDAAVTAKINTLAGTNFESLRNINREAIRVEVGRVIGDKLGIGDVYPVAAFRDAMSAQLVSAFDGGQSRFFSGELVARVEQTVVSGWAEISDKAQEVGNPMSNAGPPRDAAHAAQRAANRKRQEKYRKKHYLKWVPLGYRIGAGNGREGLTGKESGNTKAVLTEKQKLHIGGL